MTLLRYFTFSLGLLVVFAAPKIYGQCKPLDSSRGTVYLTYEQAEMPRVNARKVAQEKRIVLRLNNNSECPILVASGGREKSETHAQSTPNRLLRIRNEIDEVLPAGKLIPSLQFRYYVNGSAERTVGSNTHTLQLGSGDFLRFEVPADFRKAGPMGRVEVDVDFLWDTSPHPLVNQTAKGKTSVVFWRGDLP